ncbi:hypothetical protein [Anaerovorax sp. IOR16]|uniref:hypothetical protein n=1 Tax=Anaerovorax sp. IOR16 TaxID=2773458 RepID=UPI001AD8B0A8|nr:hypothetical protein [Anaerovorax sp. IOR16]
MAIARKPRIAEATDTFDDSHTYKCLRCGAEHQNPVKKFYRSEWSELFLKNDRYVPLCIKCVNEIFSNISNKYGTETACIILCYMMDIPFYHSLYDSIVKNNNIFSIGVYKRQLNNKQYQFQSFQQTILNEELYKTDDDIREEKEVKWTADKIKNKNDAINIIGYDPFDGYSSNDRRFLFGELVKYFDDDISEDTFKLSQIIQIVNNNNQIRQYDLLISSLNPIRDANDIKMLGILKKNCVDSNDKIAKENEISVKNRSNKDIGKSTLTYLMRDLREKDFKKAEANYYDQLKSEGTLWAISMSNKAIKQNGMFDENDKQEIFDIQRETIQKLQSELDEVLEKNRLLLIENADLKSNKDGDKNE